MIFAMNVFVGTIIFREQHLLYYRCALLKENFNSINFRRFYQSKLNQSNKSEMLIQLNII